MTFRFEANTMRKTPTPIDDEIEIPMPQAKERAGWLDTTACGECNGRPKEYSAACAKWHECKSCAPPVPRPPMTTWELDADWFQAIASQLRHDPVHSVPRLDPDILYEQLGYLREGRDFWQEAAEKGYQRIRTLTRENQTLRASFNEWKADAELAEARILELEGYAPPKEQKGTG